MTEATTRLTIRVSADDLAWITEHADDEGVDNATMVKMLINRLRRGRAPLMSMIEQQPAGLRPGPIYTFEGEPPAQINQFVVTNNGDTAVADDVLASRMAEIDASGASQVVQFPAEESAAIPMRRTSQSTLYNPKPK